MTRQIGGHQAIEMLFVGYTLLSPATLENSKKIHNIHSVVSVTGAAIWQGLGIQLFWVLFFYVVARWTWRRGIRHYTAFGG